MEFGSGELVATIPSLRSGRFRRCSGRDDRNQARLPAGSRGYHERRPLQNLYFDLDGLAFAFPTLGEPGGKAFGKTLGSEAKAGFEAAIGGRECVVKVGGVGEIAHGELIEPFERTRAPLPANHHFHLKFLRVHRV